MKKQTELEMGTAPVGRLLMKMAIPITLSMLVHALYNIVDSAFVGRISEAALSAVSVNFPFQTLFSALNIGIGVGMSQLISVSRGRGQPDRARRAAGQGIFLALCCMAFFQLFGLLFADAFFRLSGMTGDVARMGSLYLKIITVFSAGLFLEFVLERMLMATGRTKATMACQITGALLNLVLDPILIFGLGPIPAMGVRGAAIATVAAQHAAALLAWILHRRYNAMLQFTPADVKPHKKSLAAICSVGSSAAIKQGAAAIVLMFVNVVLIRFHTEATAVYGAYNRLYVLFLTPTWAVQNVLVILAAYNLGIRSRERIHRLFSCSVTINLVIAGLGCAFLIGLPGPLLKLFGAREAMLELGRTALPILCTLFPLQAVASTISSLLQGLGEGKTALRAGLLERFVFPLACLYLFSLAGSLQWVWWSFTAAELLGMAVSIAMLRRVFREKLAVLSA